MLVTDSPDLGGFRGSLEERHVVVLRKLLSHVRGHDLPVGDVTLVGDQDSGNIGRQGVPVTLVHPGREVLEGAELCHVVHEDHGVDVAVVVLDHALAETLLSRSVPQLKLQIKQTVKGMRKR